jgi:glycosyltransferase 2 family protein
MKKIPKIVQTVFKLIISLAFFSVLLSFVRGNELVAVFKNINWPFFIFSFIVTFIMLAASCAKWKIILDLKEQPPSYWQLFKIYLIGYFFSNILPSTVGGDVVRSYYAGKLIENQSYAAVSVFVERFSGIFFLFLLVAVAPLFRVELYTNPYLFIPAGAGLFCAAVTLWICMATNPFALPNKLAEGIFAALNRFASNHFGGGLVKPLSFAENLYRTTLDRLKKLKSELRIAVEAVKNNRKFLGRLIFLTVIFYVLTWVNVYTAFKAFNVEVNFLAICALVPAIMLVAHVPVTLLGNLGYFESVFVFYFLLGGVGGAESLAMGLLLRLKMLCLGGLGFVTYLVYRQKHRLPPAKGDFAA